MLYNKILLFDNSALMHVLKHSTDIKRLKKNELDTYIIFNFLFRLQLLMRKIKPSVCIFARDSRTSKRQKIYPEYKQKRKTREKSQKEIELDRIAYPQFTEIEEKVIPLLGYKNIFQTNGLEADDIIASVCKHNKSSDIVIVSNDEDLYQLLTNTTCILNARSNKVITRQNFIKKYGIEPNDWKKVKAVGGCVSDNVVGLPGVAEKTVINYLLGNLPEHYKTHQKIKSKEYNSVILRNKKLVCLPFKGTPVYEIDFQNVPTKKGIKKVGEKYNFLPIKKDFKFWCKTLRGF
jgi:DNA polymerase-1